MRLLRQLLRLQPLLLLQLLQRRVGLQLAARRLPLLPLQLLLR